MACPVSPTTSEASSCGPSSGGGNRFIDTVRKALILRVRNPSTESVPQHLGKKAQSAEPSPPSNRQSTSNLKQAVNGKRSPLGSSPDFAFKRRDSQQQLMLDNNVRSSGSSHSSSSSSLTTINRDDLVLVREAEAKKVDVPGPLQQQPQQQRVVSESDDSSLNSELELDQAVYPDSDTGLESMSSAEAQHERAGCATGSAKDAKEGLDVESLKIEITQLKCDKLDLLRQNVVGCVGLGKFWFQGFFCLFPG